MAAKWQQWMPLYLNRLRGSLSVQAMSGDAFKGYIYLLMASWESEDCTIPSSDAELAVLSGLMSKWKKNAPAICAKFQAVTVTVGDTVTERLQNTVLLEIWKDTKRIYDARSLSGHRTNQIRSPKQAKDGDRYGDHDAIPPTRTGTVTETETKTGTRGTPPSAPPDLTPVNAEPLDPLPFDAEPEDNIPDGLAPMQYAHFVLTEAAIPAGYALKVKTGDAIEMLARLESCGMAAATKRLLDRMRAAQARGDKVNGFWLEDGRWKKESGDSADAERDAFLAGAKK